MSKTCEWHGGDPDESTGYYDTACGKTFITVDGSEDIEEWAKFCCYCGGSLTVKKYEEDN